MAVTQTLSTAQVVTVAAKSASAAPVVNVANGAKLWVEAAVSAVTGTTPQLTISVEWSYDSVNWFSSDPADSFTAITAAASKAKSFDVKGNFARLDFAVSGTTPSFTVSAVCGSA